MTVKWNCSSCESIFPQPDIFNNIFPLSTKSQKEKLFGSCGFFSFLDSVSFICGKTEDGKESDTPFQVHLGLFP